MTNTKNMELWSVFDANAESILEGWIARLNASGMAQTGRIREAELRAEAKRFIGALGPALRAGNPDIQSASFDDVREILTELSRTRALQGFSPKETANFIFSMKEPWFDALTQASATDPELYARNVWNATRVIDGLGLFTTEVYQRSREEVIARQQREISELSTPVVKLWRGILAMPLIGTLDSERTQVVMESLLQSIVDQSAEIAIIDITGVPTVDTLVAQHLLKTVSAARLMGADCIISGIRPQIAQTMVHLGVELNVVSKATLADAFALALTRTGRGVVPIKSPTATAAPLG
jgi:rsbT co-antagonist protein RsbR